jgi:hypothetical protein
VVYASGRDLASKENLWFTLDDHPEYSGQNACQPSGAFVHLRNKLLFSVAGMNDEAFYLMKRKLVLNQMPSGKELSVRLMSPSEAL